MAPNGHEIQRLPDPREVLALHLARRVAYHARVIALHPLTWFRQNHFPISSEEIGELRQEARDLGVSVNDVVSEIPKASREIYLSTRQQKQTTKLARRLIKGWLRVPKS